MLFADEDPTEPSATAPTTTRPELPVLEVETPPLTPAADEFCPRLIAALPLVLSDAASRPVRSASPYAVAWGEPPIVLRCGVPRPAGLAADSFLAEINGVAWFTEPAEDGTRWTAIDRSVFVDVLIPTAQASGPVAVLSAAITDQLPAIPTGAGPTPTR